MNAEDDNRKNANNVEEVPIRLRWGSSNNLETIYANHLYVTHAGNEFFLVFGELAPVLELDLNNLPEFLEIQPVVRIAVSPENMMGIAKTIHKNVADYKDKLRDENK